MKVFIIIILGSQLVNWMTRRVISQTFFFESILNKVILGMQR